MKREISPGEMIPRFYGIAYYDYPRNRAICYPLFINLIVMLWREFVYWNKVPRRSAYDRCPLSGKSFDGVCDHTALAARDARIAELTQALERIFVQASYYLNGGHTTATAVVETAASEASAALARKGE